VKAPDSRLPAPGPEIVLLVVIAGCGGAQRANVDPCAGDHVIVGVAEVAALSGCRTVGGDVVIRGAGELDLSGLRVEEIDGDLTIGPTFALDVVSVEGVRWVGGTVSVVSNAAATGIYLAALEEAGNVEVASNLTAQGVTLSGLHVVRGDLAVERNPALENLHLGSLEEVGGTLSIADNDLLEIVEIDEVRAGAVRVSGKALPSDLVVRLRH
jgi:hypothetical protein